MARKFVNAIFFYRAVRNLRAICPGQAGEKLINGDIRLAIFQHSAWD